MILLPVLGTCLLASTNCAELLGADFDSKTLEDAAGGSGGSAGAGSECTVDADCNDRCLPRSPLCSDGACTCLECVTTADCVAIHGTADPHACVANECVKLLSEDCTELHGDWQAHAPPPIFLGILEDRSSPYHVADRPSGIEYYWDAMHLAREQIEHAIVGPGTPARKLVFVECDEMVNAVRAAQHLVDDVGVNLLIGPSTSENQLAVYQQVLLPLARDQNSANDAVMLTRTAFDTVLRDSENNGKVWSISPSSSLRSIAVQRLLEAQAPEIRSRMGIEAGSSLRIALVTVDIAGYERASDEIARNVHVDGKSLPALAPGTFRKFVLETDNPVGCDENCTKLVGELIAFRPHVVITHAPDPLYGALIRRMERDWNGNACAPGADLGVADRPFHIESVWDYTTTSLRNGCPVGPPLSMGPDFASRIRIVDFYPVPERYAAFLTEFEIHVKTPVTGADTGMALAYDSIFFAAYALHMVLKDDSSRAINGTIIANDGFLALGSLVGKTLHTGTRDVSEIADRIRSNQSVNLHGVVAPLKVTTANRSVSRNYDIMCPYPNLSDPSHVPFEFSGQWFDVETGKLSGTYACE